MGTLELIFIAASLAMDAFAVSLCKGLGMKKFNPLHAFIVALFFGVFQGIMPLIGWVLGSQFAVYIESLDHWIAFVLLAVIGGKMLIDAFKEESECDCCEKHFILDVKELLVLAVATSIDALAVGISFAFFKINIVASCAVIAGITLALSFFGVIIGNKFGSKFEKKAEIFGGVVLVLIGLKILIEHLFC